LGFLENEVARAEVPKLSFKDKNGDAHITLSYMVIISLFITSIQPIKEFEIIFKMINL
jgi:hypothetical protein